MNRSACLISTCALFALMTSTAHAVELYENPPPQRVVVVSPPPSQPVRVVVRQPAPLPNPVIVRPAPRPQDEQEAPRLVLGAGIGPMFALSSPSLSVVPIGHAHIGLALDAVEFGVRVGFAPYAASIANADGEEADAGLYTTDATFTLRLFEDADVHPVFGAGVGAVITTPAGRPAAAGFGISARAGLELGFPFEDGDIGAGLDAIYTQVVGAEEGFTWELASTLTIGVHLDYRF